MLFVTTDIHGHFTVLKSALEAAGFDQDNPEHELLLLGDYFDRGEENREVLEFLLEMDKRNKGTFILGNHDLFLLEFLEGDDRSTKFNAVHNGFDQTLADLSGMPFDPDNLKTIRKRIEKRYPQLYDFIATMPLYVEKKKYLFTHGGIDGRNPNWKTEDRKTFVWNYQSRLEPLPDKITVVGHERTAMIRMRQGHFNGLDYHENQLFEPIETDKVIYLDAYVEFSKRLNVMRFDID